MMVTVYCLAGNLRWVQFQYSSVVLNVENLTAIEGKITAHAQTKSKFD